MDAVIFDLDGTMIDNMMVHHRAWQKKLSSLGIEWSLEDVRTKVHGVNVELLERNWPGKWSLEERIRISAEKEATYREIYEPQLLPGLGEFLHELRRRNVLMGVGSAAPPENVDFVFNTLDLWRYFVTVRHSADVQNGKPHPEVYLKIIDELDMAPEECLVFEDTPTGAEAAQRAGCKAIVVTTTHQKEEFDHLHNIVKFIQDFTEVTTKEILEL